MGLLYQQSLSVLILTLTVGTLSTSATDDDCFYPTRFDSRWTRKCRHGQFISSLDSVYQDDRGDRTWKICCRNLPLPKFELAALKCDRWTRSQNRFGGKLNFSCANNGYISGIKSYHCNRWEDRKFKFECCHVPNHSMTDCHNWGPNNMFQAKSTFRVEEGRVLTGMSAIFSRRFKDRVFENTDCHGVTMVTCYLVSSSSAYQGDHYKQG